MAVTKVLMPKLSEQMETGKVIKWLKHEGDRIQSGDILAEVETDKADVEMEAFGAGVLRKILVTEGNKAPVGGLIAVIAEPGDDITAVVNEAASAAPAPAAKAAAGATEMASRIDRSGGPEMAPRTPPPAQPAKPFAPAPVAPARPSAVPTPVVPPASGERVKASPLARKVAAQSGVDLRLVHGSGPGGRVVRKDVEAAAASGPRRLAAPVVTGPEFEDVALSQMRAAIARRMPLSKAPVPHFYVTTEVAMDLAVSMREQLNALEGQPKISMNDLVVRAAALTLLQHPGVNASFQGESIRVFHRAHIGIAVALEEGLITPVLRDAQAKSLAQIAGEARDLAERARNRKLRAPEMSGATFSISNLGMYEVTEFSAIINPPEGAILAVGAVRKVPVVTDEGLGVGRRMMLTLSCDHRVMDGAMGARFLQDLTRLLEQPLRLVL
ncbi:MAG TPA: dihydrolipoamide acetyltransferase family protein [Methylomirabilota bacterium]|nr:dihydrolipoamide acetyltransferase family protein [Methylomirabilota bacterium]